MFRHKIWCIFYDDGDADGDDDDDDGDDDNLW